MNTSEERLQELLNMLTQGRGQNLVPIPEGSWPYPEGLAENIAEWAREKTATAKDQFNLGENQPDSYITVSTEHLSGRYWLVTAVPDRTDQPESNAVIAGTEPEARKRSPGTHLVHPDKLNENENVAETECGEEIHNASQDTDWTGPDGILEIVTCQPCRASELFRSISEKRKTARQEPPNGQRADGRDANNGGPRQDQPRRTPQEETGQPEGNAGTRRPPQGQPPNPNAPRPKVQHANELAEPWQTALKALAKETGDKYNLAALLRDCRTANLRMDGERLIAPFRNGHNLERMREELSNPATRHRVDAALTDALGVNCKLEVTLEKR